LPGSLRLGRARDQSTTFAPVAAVTPLPIMIYNNPLAYSVDARRKCSEMADEPKFVAIKESCGDVRRVRA